MKTPARFKAQLADALVTNATEIAARPEPTRRRVPSWHDVVRSRPAVRLATPTAVAVVIITGLLLLARGGGVAPQTASAASVLRAAADRVQRGASLSLGRGDYLYTRVLVWWHNDEHPDMGAVRTVEETWQARDGAGRSQTRVLNASRHDRWHDVTAKLPPQARPFLLDPFTTMSYAQLRRLPTNAQQLASAVNRLADQEGRRLGDPGIASRAAWHGAFAFSILRGIAVSPSPAPVRAAVYRTLSATPGIKLVGRGRDVLGRSGMVLETTLGAFRFVLVVDPSTGQLLQSSRTLLRRSPQAPGWRPGLINRATYEKVAVVRSTRAR